MAITFHCEHCEKRSFLIIAAVVTLSVGITIGQEKNISEQSILRARAVEESMIPIRPGRPGKSPFWNRYARRFIYVPAFNFKPVKGAVKYRFTATSKADNKDYVFEANEPWAPLTPIWRELPVGRVVLTIEGLDKRGRVIEMLGEARKFYRAATFNGPYHKQAVDYQKSARRALKYLFKQKYFQRWAKDGKPDPSYVLYCYPSKTIGAVIRSMIMYSKLSPPDAHEALLIARKAAEYLISTSEPVGATLEYFPQTYAGSGLAAKNRKGQIMMNYPAEAATAYLDLYDTTKDVKFFNAAKKIADTYVKLQMPCGTWPLMLKAEIGKPITKNLCVPVMWIHPFFERLVTQYGLDEYKTTEEKIFRWVMKNPMETFNWEGQFEDQSIRSAKYDNLTGIDAAYLAIYLLDHNQDNPQYIAQAEELLRFTEDQFVVWERIMPRKYQRRKDLPCDTYILPCGLEQYHYYEAIGGVASIFIEAYQKAYEVTDKELYLAKACALANSITVAQNLFNQDGTYPTCWGRWTKKTGEERKKSIARAVSYMWTNCVTIDARAMLNLGRMLAKKKR